MKTKKLCLIAGLTAILAGGVFEECKLEAISAALAIIAMILLCIAGFLAEQIS